MRIGQNPQKNSGRSIEPPATITVGVLNYIPDQAGFFRGQLDSLKLCLASLQINSGQPFDLLVLDNGSCDEVRNYLTGELKAGRINHLILNQRNIGKGNALFQILGSAPGNLVFFSDGDFYYRQGWMQAHLDVFGAFPEAGMVSGDPRRNQANRVTSASRHWVAEHQESLVLEKGDLIPEEWIRQSLHSHGDEQYFEKWAHDEDWRISRDGITAYIGACHGQFLIPRHVIEAIPRRRSNKALASADDRLFDETIEKAGFLRLSVAHPSVYHIGNAIGEDWLKEEYRRLVGDNPDAIPAGQMGEKHETGSYAHRFWGHWRVQRVLRAIYQWTFEKYSRNS
jgi:hypothetical protein